MLDTQDNIKLIKMTYLPQYHTFDVECMMPGKVTPEVRRFNLRNFPDHKPFKLKNGLFKLSQEVRIWLKDEKELRKEGWGNLTQKGKTLINKNTAFTIGKHKGKFLGGQSVRGFIGISEKMVPYVVVKDGDKYWRFTQDMIRFILPLTDVVSVKGKNTVLKCPSGYNLVYESGRIKGGPFGIIDEQYVRDVISLLRKAEVI